MSRYLLPLWKAQIFAHQLNIISKKNEPVLLFKTNNLGNEARKHEHGLKLEKVGPS